MRGAHEVEDGDMALRIRKDGRILCAAAHPEEPGDTYLHDGISYRLTVALRAIVSEPMVSELGRGGHSKHHQWWWANEVPNDVVIETTPGVSGASVLNLEHAKSNDAHCIACGFKLAGGANVGLCPKCGSDRWYKTRL